MLIHQQRRQHQLLRRFLHTVLPKTYEQLSKEGETARTLAAAFHRGHILTTTDKSSEHYVAPETLPQNVKEAYDVLRLHTYHSHHDFNEELVGWKVGATSLAAQKRLGLDSPFIGPLFRSRVFHDQPFKINGRILGPIRGVEAEYAFVLGKDLELRDTPFTRDEVIDAIEAVYPVIEVVGTRFAEPVGAYPLIADAGGNAALLVGDPLKTTVDYLANHLDKEVAVKVNGKVEGKGNGKDVLGNPLHALEWVANTLQRVGLQLRAGDTVSTGTMTGIAPVAPGDEVQAVFNGLGTLRATVVE